jgi:hypothetical protein
VRSPIFILVDLQKIEGPVSIVPGLLVRKLLFATHAFLIESILRINRDTLHLARAIICREDSSSTPAVAHQLSRVRAMFRTVSDSQCTKWI